MDQICRPYSLEESGRVIGEALDAREYGLRVVISNNECMLARQRKERRNKAKAPKVGQTVVQEKFGVDEEVVQGIIPACASTAALPSH